MWPNLCIVGFYFLWPSIFVTKLLNVIIGSSPIYSKNEDNICIFYFECPIITGPTHKAQLEKPTRCNPNVPDNFGNPIRTYILHFLHGSAESQFMFNPIGFTFFAPDPPEPVRCTALFRGMHVTHLNIRPFQYFGVWPINASYSS